MDIFFAIRPSPFIASEGRSLISLGDDSGELEDDVTELELVLPEEGNVTEDLAEEEGDGFGDVSMVTVAGWIASEDPRKVIEFLGKAIDNSPSFKSVRILIFF